MRVQAAGRHAKVKVQTTDSPASAGDGFYIRLPVELSFTGAVLNQSGTATIAASSPLDNPKSITFATAYSTAPEVTVTAKGSTAIIAVVDNVSATGFDLYLFDLSGNRVDGSADWSARGT